jgi:hypothetical protein
LLWILVLLSTAGLKLQAQSDDALQREQEEKEEEGSYETRAKTKNGQDNIREEVKFEKVDGDCSDEEEDDEESPDEEWKKEEWEDEEEWDDEDELFQDGDVWDIIEHLKCFEGPGQPVFHNETV